MCVSLSVPGVGTAHPSACADQPSRPSTACQSTRRGRPRRCWRARRRLSRAAPSSPSLRRAGAGPPCSYLPAAACSATKTRDAEPVSRREPASRRHTWTRRTWPAQPRKRALTFEASGELPALAVRRMLRQHDCADSVASDGGGGGAGEAEQDEQAGEACAVAAARCGERALAAQVCRGGESADYLYWLNT